MGGLRYLDDSLQTVVRDLNALQRAHPEVYCGSRSAANVALLWPQATADLGGTRTPLLATAQARIYPPAPPGSVPPTAPGLAMVQEEFYGWAEALFRAGYAYDIIDDEALEEAVLRPEALARYEAIILPAAQCLSEAACGAVEAYVRAGGHQVATGTTSLCDERDQARADFALAPVFGASFAGRQIGPFPIDYLMLEGSAVSSVGSTAVETAVLAGLDHDVIPAPPSAVAVRPVGAQVLAAHLHQLRTRYEPLRPDETPTPAILTHRYGEGTCVYLAGAFGSAYWQHRFPDYRRLLRNAVAWRCAPQVMLSLHDGSPAPDSIEISWRRATDGRWLLHLVNHTGTMSRPIEQVLAIQNLRLTLRALAGAAGVRRAKGELRAHALVAGIELPVTQENGNPATPVVVLPHLDAYEAIVLW
jgi:hypothetical protein